MVTDEMVEAAAEALRKAWFGGHGLTGHGAEVIRAQARTMLLAALAAVPVAEEVESVAVELEENDVAERSLAQTRRAWLDNAEAKEHEERASLFSRAASLLRRLSAERDEAIEARAHDMARQSSVIAFLRKRRGRLVIERDEAIRQRDQAREALRAVRPELGCHRCGATGKQLKLREHIDAALQGGEHG